MIKQQPTPKRQLVGDQNAYSRQLVADAKEALIWYQRTPPLPGGS